MDQFEVRGVLGEGGFGIVYLAYWREWKHLVAIKASLRELATDEQSLERFRREALLWATMGHHPNIVFVHAVERLSPDQLLLVMEYIVAPDAELSSVGGYLREKPPGLAVGLRWVIDACRGLEYGYSNGLTAHRDIKPDNILIDREGRARVSDLGLAGRNVAERRPPWQASPESRDPQALGQITADGTGMGTLTHMPPEQFMDAAKCDQRSDVYALGVVLFQLAGDGQPPFTGSASEIGRLHARAAVPPLASPLDGVISKCLEKRPGDRYATVDELRHHLERAYTDLTGQPAPAPARWEMSGKDWCNRGSSLFALGQDEEALHCYEQAIALDPTLGKPWHNIAWYHSLRDEHEDALRYFDKAIELEPDDAIAWNAKGVSLRELGRQVEALECFREANTLDPDSPRVWRNLGRALAALERRDEGTVALRQAVQLDPADEVAWFWLGALLYLEGSLVEAAECLQRSVATGTPEVAAWKLLGDALSGCARSEVALAARDKASYLKDALTAYDQALRLDPSRGEAWYDCGTIQQELGQVTASVQTLTKCVAIDPEHEKALVNLCSSLTKLNMLTEAHGYAERAVALEPGDPIAWWQKGECEIRMGRYEACARSLRRVVDLAAVAPQGLGDLAAKRLAELPYAQ